MPQTGMSEKQYHHVLNLTKALWRVTDIFPSNDVLARQLREKSSEIFSLAVEFGCSGQYEREQKNIQAKITSLVGFLELALLMKWVKPINIIFLSKEYSTLRDFFRQEFKRELEEHTSSHHPPVPEKESKKNLPQIPVHQDKEGIYSPPPSFAKRDMKDTPSQSEERGEFSGNGKIRPNRSLRKEEARKISIEPPLQQKEKIQKTRSVPLLQKEENVLNDRQRAIIEHMSKIPEAKVSDFSEMFIGVSSKTVQRDLQDLATRNILKKEGEKRWTTYSLVQ